MSAIVLEDTKNNEFKILALATGTKSIGRCYMNKDGYILNDCHAEVLAR